MCMLGFNPPPPPRGAEKHAELDSIKNDGPVKESYAREGGDT